MQYDVPVTIEGALSGTSGIAGRSVARSTRLLRDLARDTNAAAVSAGLATFILCVFSALMLQLAVLSEIGFDSRLASSSVVITWLTSALGSIFVSLRYRQPIPVGWTLPGLIYLGAVAPRFTPAELAAANLAAGLVILVFAFLGAGERLMRWMPLPIVMGMFAASTLGYMTRLVQVTVDEGIVAGATVAGFLIGKILGRPRLPAMLLAVISGGIAVALSGSFASNTIEWQAPALVVPALDFSPSALLAVSMPLALLTLGLGNAQGLGFIAAQGYRVPVRGVSVLIGMSSVANALFGGHPAAVARVSSAMLGGDDAGPKSGRYTGSIIAGVLFLTVALAAPLVIAVVTMLPSAYVLALAGLGILAAFQGALEKAFSGPLRFGAVIAFAVAATPFTIAGIPAAFWAILAGCAASYACERNELHAAWRGNAAGG
jgi:benzoate membrane transport protein